MKYLNLIISILFFSVFIETGVSQIIDYNVYAIKDAELRSDSVSTNFGNDTTFSIGRTGSTTRRGVLQFDLSSIPSNAIIYEAKLKLNIVNNSGDVMLNTARLLDNWHGDSITWGNQPDYETWDIEAGALASSGKINIDLKEQVQRMVVGVHENNGWILFSDDETSSSENYYRMNSQESVITDSKPILEIKYYLPIEVISATIVHESADGESDGSVSPILSYTSGSNTYSWSNSSDSIVSTNLNLENVSYGLYTLKVNCIDSTSSTLYQKFSYNFVVGLENEVIDLNLSTINSTSHAYIANYYATGLGSDQNFSDDPSLVCGQINTDLGWANAKSLLKFNLWVDPIIQINQADLVLYGLEHINDGRDNKAEFNLIIEDWNKDIVTWNTTPNYTDSILVPVNETSTSTQNQTIDISPYWNYWKNNNTENNGIIFQLEVYDEVGYAVQNYRSPAPDEDDYDTLQPIVYFQFDLRKKMVWDTVTNTGTINVGLYDIVDKTAPYKYIISKNPIPDLEDSYAFLNDSVFEGTLDSLSFFSGTENLSHSFNNLKSAKYHVAVFDADWDRIVDEEISVYGNFEFLSQVNLEIEGNEISATSGDGYGTINSYAYDGENSALEAQFDSYDGVQYFGYSLFTDSIVSSYTDLIHGFYTVNDTLYTVENGMLSGTYTIVDSLDLLGISVSDTTLYLKVNNEVVSERALEHSFAFKTGIKLNPTSAGGAKIWGSSTTIHSIPLYSVSPKLVNHAICDGTVLGSFKFTLEPFLNPWGGGHPPINLNYSIVLPGPGGLGYLIQSGSVSSYSGGYISVNNLTPGVYLVSVTVPGSGTYTKPFTIGYEANWDQVIDYNITPNVYSLKRLNSTTSNIINSSFASTNNFLHSGTDGWTEFTMLPNTIATNNVIRASTNNIGSLDLDFLNEDFIFYQTPYLFWNIGGVIDGTSAVIPPNKPIRIEFNSNSISIIIDGNLVTSNNSPIGATASSSSIDRILRFQSMNQNNGFRDVITSFPCREKEIYAKVERDLKGVKYKPYINKLYFYMDEEYENLSADLDYKIYSSLDRVNSVINGVVTPLPNEYGDNRYKLDVSSLSIGAYILEVTNEKDEKFYLRFFVK